MGELYNFWRVFPVTIQACGFTPWIVLDNVPHAMSEKPVKNKYGNTEPPADFKVWSSYVRQLVHSLVELSFDDTGNIRFNLVLSGHSVVHLQLRRQSSASQARSEPGAGFSA